MPDREVMALDNQQNIGNEIFLLVTFLHNQLQLILEIYLGSLRNFHFRIKIKYTY